MNRSTVAMMVAVLTGVIGSSTLHADMTAGDVLNDLHQANQQEIRMGQLAVEKGSTPDVRDYGKMLIDDHQANDQKVIALAAKSGVSLKNADAGIYEKIQMSNLKGFTGRSFDENFAKHMVADHKKDIESLQSAQKSPLPQDIREFVGDTLPALQKHLERGQKLSGNAS